MLLIVKVFILIALIKAVLEFDRPAVCAAVYAGAGLLFGLGLGREFPVALVAGAIGFLLAWVYFFLLHRTQGSAVFWVILVGGLLIGVV